MERVRVCVSLKVRERRDSGLLREFRRCLSKAASRPSARLETKIDEIGARLAAFPHHRLQGSNRFRARVGDYRIIYVFDLGQNTIHLLATDIVAKSIARCNLRLPVDAEGEARHRAEGPIGRVIGRWATPMQSGHTTKVQ